MSQQSIIWIASWPRSGNTLLRTVLWYCFGLKSASVYPNDLGGNTRLEDQVGHIERDIKGGVFFPKGNPPLFKTHEYPVNNNATIYIVREGHSACVSLWNFYNKKSDLNDIIAGNHRFGTWANHLAAWKPWERDNLLLIKYEDIVSDLPMVLDHLNHFLGRNIISNKIPARNDMASIEGRWIRKKSDWRDHMDKQEVELFEQHNGDMMRRMGY